MSPRTAARLAWGLWALAALMIAGSAALVALAWGIPTPGEDFGPDAAGFLVALVAFPTVGAVVASRRPGEAIGWLFCGVGVVLAASAFAPQYADYALYAKPGSLPGGQWFAWATGWLDPMFISSLALILFLFPTGQLPSRRWRPALWLLILSVATAVPKAAFQPGLIFEDTLPVANPLGIESARALFGAMDVAVSIILVVAVLASAASMVVRFQHARGEERQQVKWLAYAAGLLVAAVAAAIATEVAGGVLEALATAFIGFAFAAIPVAAGIAILRYRLYDIDRIINRTLVYGLLTGALGGGYFGGVVLLQLLSRPVTGGSGLAVAATTLLVAAVFQPARRRIQDAVDRRFNRRKYDAARTIEAFSARLRQQTDLDTLTEELLAVVRETMQPARVSLWLRAAEGRR